MNMSQAAVLEPIGEGEIALQDVAVKATLRGLLSEVNVSQIYTNLEQTNIEAVYTFPLPLDAVLMELTLELNGEVLRGEIKPRSEAEADYEGAVEGGDSAVLLTQVRPGLFTVNVGNLLAGEQAVVRFRYAQLHRWQGDSLRFYLPTTLAPRYGDPFSAGLRPHEVPESTLTADYGFSLDLTIEGELATADMECPSHRVAMDGRDGQLRLSLAGGTRSMDRDFILVIRQPNGYTGEGLWAEDINGIVALASFHPELPQPAEPQPRCIKLVIDCSGSMGGDSIVQARAALREILDLLRPEDWFNLTLFGSHHRLLFPEPVPADDRHVSKAGRLLQTLDADMGGTELGAALDATYSSGGPGGVPTDLLLITDGEVWQHEELLQAARNSGHRLFTVGVGSAVSEALLQSLAEGSGGACERVSPNEQMAERIVRHFKRIHQPAVTHSQLHWPARPLRQSPPTLDTVYAGDTLHIFGWLPVAPNRDVVLELTLPNGMQQESVGLRYFADAEKQPGTLARLAAHSRLASMGDEEAEALAIQYQLVTDQTSCVLVKQRGQEEMAEGIPALRKVPHQLAAGWGGAGSVSRGVDFDIDEIQASMCNSKMSMDIQLSVLEERDAPKFCMRSEERPVSLLIELLNDAHDPVYIQNLQVGSLGDLERLGAEREILDALRQLLDEGYTEPELAIAWLSLLMDLPDGYGASRHLRRLIHQEEKRLGIYPSLKERIESLLKVEA